MSSQKGNVSRTRAQKHKNATAYKNTLHDTSHWTKNILKTTQDGLCARCKEVIEWKIKYKKYKPLTQPATCVRCHQKTVKKAYYTVCQPCATQHEVCAKCAKKKEIVNEFETDERTKAAEQSRMEEEIKYLSERERRTLFRLQAKGKLLDGATKTGDDDDEEDDLDQEATAAGSDSLKCDDEDENCDNDDDGDCGLENEGEKVSAYTLFE